MRILSFLNDQRMCIIYNQSKGYKGMIRCIFLIRATRTAPYHTNCTKLIATEIT